MDRHGITIQFSSSTSPSEKRTLKITTINKDRKNRMHPLIQRFLQNFSFRINYRVIRYIIVCAVALAAAMVGAWVSDGDLAWIILAGTGCYIAGRIVVWIFFREY